jgi:hypothetical protein
VGPIWRTSCLAVTGAIFCKPIANELHGTARYRMETPAHLEMTKTGQKRDALTLVIIIQSAVYRFAKPLYG